MRTWSVEQLADRAITFGLTRAAVVAHALLDLIPSDAVRDARAVTAAAAEFDAEEGLAEFEEANEVHEPQGTRTVRVHADDPFFYRNDDGTLKPKELKGDDGSTWTISSAPRAQCMFCGDADTPGHDCGRQYHDSTCGREHCVCKLFWQPGGFLTRAEHERAAAEHLTPVEAVQRRLNRLLPKTDLSPSASAAPGDNPAGVESPTPPAGVDPPSRTSPKGDGEGPPDVRAIPLSASGGHPSFTEWVTPVIAGALERHRYRGYNVRRCGCYDPDVLDRSEWENHAAELIARRIEAALTQEGKHVIVTQIYNP